MLVVDEVAIVLLLLMLALPLSIPVFAVVVDVATSCLMLIFSLILGVLERFSGITGDTHSEPPPPAPTPVEFDVCDKGLFLEVAHRSQSSVSGDSEIRFGHALHVVHSVSINCAKVSSSLMRRGEGIFTYNIKKIWINLQPLIYYNFCYDVINYFM